MANKKEENPMFTKKGAWLWLVCPVAALFVSAHYESKKDVAKKEMRKRKKNGKKSCDIDEFDWWQDNQGF